MESYRPDPGGTVEAAEEGTTASHPFRVGNME